MKIAVLGGSFNPPHNGHFMLAEEAALRLGYDMVFFVPAHISPFKQDPNFAGRNSADDEDRINMLNGVVLKNNLFKIEDCEIKRGGVSYTIDTVRYLKEKYKDCLEGKIGFIMGDDLVEDFSKWKEPDLLAAEVDLIVARRYASEQDVTFNYPHLVIDNAVLPISSSGVRKAIRDKKSWRYLVPNTVYQYITERHLYE